VHIPVLVHRSAPEVTGLPLSLSAAIGQASLALALSLAIGLRILSLTTTASRLRHSAVRLSRFTCRITKPHHDSFQDCSSTHSCCHHPAGARKQRPHRSTNLNSGLHGDVGFVLFSQIDLLCDQKSSRIQHGIHILVAAVAIVTLQGRCKVGRYLEIGKITW